MGGGLGREEGLAMVGSAVFPGAVVLLQRARQGESHASSPGYART